MTPLRGGWEESDQAYVAHPEGRVRRHLHWWVAAGLGLCVAVGFGLQGALQARAEAPRESRVQEEDNALVLGQEPPLNGLRQELQRQRQPDPEPVTAALPALPALPSRKVEAMADVQRFEVEKQQAMAAGSHILAINRSADSPAPAAQGALPRSVAEATPAASPIPGLPPGISPIPAGLATHPAAQGQAAASGNAAVHPARLQAPLVPVRPASAREVLEGSLIPAVLLTQVNSDLPGMLTAQVTEDVYDSIQGNYLAIPKGSRVIGEYGSHVLAGQERIMAVFHRLILPGGESFSLDDMQAADRSGQSGMKDEVDNRFWTRLGGQFMTAGLARIIEQPEGNVTVLGGMGNSLVGDAAGQILVDTARIGFAANAAVGPVIVIKRGYPFVIMVNRDMDFSTLGH